MDEPIKLSEPIAINVNKDLPAGMMVTAIGWGKLSEKGGVPDILQEVDLPLVSDKDCAKAYPFTFKADKEICAGYKEGKKDACQGDSGGGLFKKTAAGDVLIGCTSWGEGCARPGRYGVWTKLSNVIPWIQDKAPGVKTIDLLTIKNEIVKPTEDEEDEEPTTEEDETVEEEDETVEEPTTEEDDVEEDEPTTEDEETVEEDEDEPTTDDEQLMGMKIPFIKEIKQNWHIIVIILLVILVLVQFNKRKTPSYKTLYPL